MTKAFGALIDSFFKCKLILTSTILSSILNHIVPKTHWQRSATSTSHLDV